MTSAAQKAMQDITAMQELMNIMQGEIDRITSTINPDSATWGQVHDTTIISAARRALDTIEECTK